MNEILAFQAIIFICGTGAFIASLRFLRRVIELKHERSIAASTIELRERLDRIEGAVESTAIEIERISEANRFVAKLLGERSGAASHPARPERIITPH
ncbi:MAG TPA: hypothetical protein VH539_08440 [Gemmatimonadaceae bacterium]|jgi:hypothetical protein